MPFETGKSEKIESWITNELGYNVFKYKYDNGLLAIEITEAGRDMLMFPEVHCDKPTAMLEINNFKKRWVK